MRKDRTMTRFRKLDHRRCWWESSEFGTLANYWWERKTMQLLGNVWQFFKKLAVKLQYDPEISPLGTHPRELKKKNVCLQKVLHRNVHSGTIDSCRKMQTTKTSIDWQVNKQNPCHRILFSHKRKELLIHATIQNLPTSRLSERSQASKTTCGMILFVWNSQYKQIYTDRRWISCCRGLQEGGGMVRDFWWVQWCI